MWKTITCGIVAACVLPGSPAWACPYCESDIEKEVAAKRGGSLYADHCAACHGDDGLGTEDGPPVWGEKSYNDGAGLSRIDKLASWLKVAMPLDDPYLMEQEALDIAAFVNSQPRPKFVLKEHLPKPERLGEYNSER